MNQTKPYDRPKPLIYEAYKPVKANRGSARIEAQSLQVFEQNLKNNRYKRWNRRSSGRDFPKAVKPVEILKENGQTRPLGIPTITDRMAQTAVKMRIEPQLEKHFHPDSYGYRPNQSAHQAVTDVPQRGWHRP